MTGDFDADLAAKDAEIAKLRRNVEELRASLVSSLWRADSALPRLGDRLAGGGVVLTLRVYGSDTPEVGPVLIRDGLSEAAIEALRSDIRRSFEAATNLKPKGVA